MNNKLSCIIVEDEHAGILRLRSLLEKHTHLEIIDVASNGAIAISKINKFLPDCIFLDISLGDKTGFEVLKNIIGNPMVVFTTAYDQYALDAFKFNTVDYLVKPISQERFDQMMDKLLAWQIPKKESIGQALIELENQFKPKKRKSFPIKKGDTFTLVDFDKISHFKAEDKYVRILQTNGQTHLTDKTINYLEAQLPASFIRIHRSYIINTDLITSISKTFKNCYYIHLEDVMHSKIKSSQSYAEKISDILNI